MQRHPGWNLYLVSAMILFLELACIRWFPAHVLFLTFFTNTVLLASFVGMSIGCLTARSPKQYFYRTPSVLAVAMVIGYMLNVFHSRLERYVDVAANKTNPEVVFFGAEAQPNPEFIIPVELLAGLMFLLIAVVMVGPGQVLGRAFNAIPNRLTAYSIDLLGSLTGIVLFALCSFFQLPPLLWFGMIAAVMMTLIIRVNAATDSQGNRRSLALPILALLIVLVVAFRTSGIADDRDFEIRWSPYYRIDYDPSDRVIVTNQIGHQQIQPIAEESDLAYHIPHIFNRAAGRKPFERILIIGAGSGNDVARALAWSSPTARIDAVDIEPVIQQIGIEHHPDQPYADKRVTRHLNDGRNFLRQAPDNEYDLVVYALVDSLVLHSSYGSVRLESFLFTEEAFADVRRVLKPDGAYAVYNFFRQGWLVARLHELLQTTFGHNPVMLVVSEEAVNVVENDKSYQKMHTIFYAGSSDVVEPVRNSFNGGMKLWLPKFKAFGPETTGEFAATPPDSSNDWVGLELAHIAPTDEVLPLPTDSWPFFYVRHPTIPGYIIRGSLIMLGLALGVYFYFRPARIPGEMLKNDRSMLLRMFFLGAGFMLIETKAVVNMAILCGGTWTVNTIVFFAILTTALFGNLLVAWLKPKRLEWAYIGLFLTLTANLFVGVEAFLGLHETVQIVGASLLVFSPILFAAIIFPTSFSRAVYPDRAFGANIAGALVGGLAENLSMLLGFKLLLLVAGGFYLISALGGKPSSAIPDR